MGEGLEYPGLPLQPLSVDRGALHPAVLVDFFDGPGGPGHSRLAHKRTAFLHQRCGAERSGAEPPFLWAEPELIFFIDSTRMPEPALAPTAFFWQTKQKFLVLIMNSEQFSEIKTTNFSV